ncbi:MAG: hypothetical protein M1504_04345 [Candidatus Marsarchaeota archaeon]|nr:hypothetical protein [Candidatus Marsarchaeota archaeon]
MQEAAKQHANISGRKLAYIGIAIVLIALALVFSFQNGGTRTLQPNGLLTQNGTNETPAFAHLSTANFTLIAPNSVLLANGKFESLAKEKYNFLYANASAFGSVKNSSFIVIVVNSSSDPYGNLALDAINSSTLNYALNYTHGIILSKMNVWTQGQTVFVLAGYKNSSLLSSALDSFFIKAPVHPPKQLSTDFLSYNGPITGKLKMSNASDPTLYAYLDGTYPLDPADLSLTPPYDYYENFAYLIYQAPVLSQYAPGFTGNASGYNLPLSAGICIPPPPPLDGSSICFGEYVAMPMLQFGSTIPAAPQWSISSSDCNIPGFNDCLTSSGWAASGVNPPLNWSEIPSIFYGFTATGSSIPPSMTGTSGPLNSYTPTVWWLYGPGSVTWTISPAPGNWKEQNLTQVLMDANVQMFSSPYNETPFGGFTFTNSTNATMSYGCGSNYCGMQFNYDIYGLTTITSTIPQGAFITSPHGYSQAPNVSYDSVLEPITLSTPKIVRTGTDTYYFSSWSVYSELNNNQYYQTYNTSNVTLQVIGATQAQAIYVKRSPVPGPLEISSGFMTPSAYYTCPPPMNCTSNATRGLFPVGNVSVTITSLNGTTILSNYTNANGVLKTRILPVGCYHVGDSKDGYAFIANPNPVCVDGTTGLSLVDLSPYVFKIGWPSNYPFGLAPINTKVPINLTLMYPDGSIASNVLVHAYGNTGIMNDSEATQRTSANGDITFMWRSGTVPGLYTFNLTTKGIFTGTASYTFPVILYSGNYSSALLQMKLENDTISANAGSLVNDTVNVRFCKYVFKAPANMTLSCATGAPASLMVSNLPAWASASFRPNPAPEDNTTMNDTSILHLYLSNSTPSGISYININASILVGGKTYTTSAPLMLKVNSQSSNYTGSTGCGEISGNVYNQSGHLTAANVTITNSQSGALVYKNITNTGEFSTGYTIPLGNYIAKGRNLSTSIDYVYGIESVNVTTCGIPTFVNIP